MDIRMHCHSLWGCELYFSMLHTHWGYFYLLLYPLRPSATAILLWRKCVLISFYAVYSHHRLAEIIPLQYTGGELCAISSFTSCLGNVCMLFTTSIMEWNLNKLPFSTDHVHKHFENLLHTELNPWFHSIPDLFI